MAPAHALGPLAPLAEYRQFIPVKLVPLASGKVDKLPVDHRTGNVTAKGSDGAHNPDIWLSYEHAALIAAALGTQYGVGFVLTAADPFVAVDIDNCLTPAGWSPLALDLIAALPGAVVEVSQSGKGLHVWLRSRSVPEHTMKDAALKIECYSSRRFMLLGSQANGTMAEDCPGIHIVVARYFPPRADVLADVPDDGPCAEWRGPASDEALLEIAMRSRGAASVFGDGVSFAQLWEADAEALGRKWPADGRAYDASSADMALAQRLAFFTGRDQGRVDRMMRASGLARDKYERADYLPRTISAACAQQRDVYRAPSLAGAVTPGETPIQPLTFAASSAGWIDAKIENVVDALMSAESGVRIALDLFLEAIMLSGSEGKWKPFTDADYGRLRAQFGRRGFKPVSPEIMKTAVLMAAEENKFDSAIQWAEGLQWDGVPRIDTVLPTYYRTADTAYNRAVGAYLFTALAARALQPGAQVDMVPVFVGIQGARKTSAIRVLSPDIRFFSEINLKKIDDENMARRVRGKLVGEIAELRGLAGRDQESVKAWITRREETWRPLFREFETTYPRRLVLIGTANEREFLDDPTGERRWLPVTSGAVDVEALERDCRQLWAEGVHRFKASGVAWRDAEQLARAEHARFKVLDPWAEPVERWLSEPTADEKRARSGKAGFKMDEIFSGALSRNIGTVPMADSKRMGKVLRSLGMERTEGRVNGKTVNLWARVI